MNKDLVEADRYRTDDALDDLEPKTRQTKDKYLRIYETYVLGHLTQKQVAEKFKMHPQYVGKIIKWACFYLSGPKNKEVYKQTLEDSLSYQLQKLEEILSRAKDGGRIKDELAVLAEIRRTHRLLGQVRSVIKEIGEDVNKQQINIIVPQLHRGEGVESIKEIE
jgi:hypothetical protein